MKQGEIIVTATVKKIRKFLDRTAKNSQMSFLFGPTGRGKTFGASPERTRRFRKRENRRHPRGKGIEN